MKKRFLYMVGLAAGMAVGHSAQGQEVKGKLPKKGSLKMLPVEIIYPPGTTDGVLSVFPNPATDFLEIKLPQGDAKGWALQVFDGQGQRLINKLWDGLRLDIACLDNGIYLLILTKNREKINAKFIVKR